MLPFSTYEFFAFMAVFVLITAVTKYLFRTEHYKYILACLNSFFLFAIYPQPLHFASLIIFSWVAIYVLSEFVRPKIKLWGILVLLTPMLLVKSDITLNNFNLNDIISFAGLSYASFRIMGYYMDKGPKDRMAGFISYFNFLSFTPTLLIGPIDRYNKFKASEDIGYLSINGENFLKGWNFLVKGIVFKYIIAVFIDRYWLNITPQESYNIFDMANNMYAYYFYLFFDFAGYSWMALGIGKMMGMTVPVNFTNPFVAVNPQDFWRRFHISLGDWLKDYFFTPLFIFMSRKKSLKKYPLARQNIALVLTFVLMGCWNGFHTNYILSGFLLGIFSLIHNTYLYQCRKKGRDVVFGKMNATVIKVLSITIMINAVAFALYVFSGRCPFIP